MKSNRKLVFTLIGVLAVSSIVLTGVFGLAARTPNVTRVGELEYPLIQAHRAFGDINPENTLKGLKAAWAARPDTVMEMDVRALSDGTLVLHHDATVDVPNKGTANVADMTLSEWKALSFPHSTGAAPASTLQEVFDEFADTDAVLTIELKAYAAADDFIEAVWPHRDRVIVGAFNESVVKRFVNSGLETQQIMSGVPPVIEGVNNIAIRKDLVTPEVIEEAHSKGAKVWAWTIKGQAEVAPLIKLGVDAICTDYPVVFEGGNDPGQVIPS